jgi:hypothetical protein
VHPPSVLLPAVPPDRGSADISYSFIFPPYYDDQNFVTKKGPEEILRSLKRLDVLENFSYFLYSSGTRFGTGKDNQSRRMRKKRRKREMMTKCLNKQNMLIFSF